MPLQPSNVTDELVDRTYGELSGALKRMPPAWEAEKNKKLEPLAALRFMFWGLVRIVSNVQAGQEAGFDAITARLAALEQRNATTLADAFQGTHLEGKQYERGQLVVRAGGLWLALIATSGQPGSSPDWRLVVKAPR